MQTITAGSLTLDTSPPPPPLAGILAWLADHFAARGAELDHQVGMTLLVRRLLAQPTMTWPGTQLGYRSQPRDGRGRLLSKAWLAAAETFTPADLAWFGRSTGGGL